ncbi:site-2 protease family protein [Candidatus Saccharibacteria bacterium]|nr:site-2 protease family protein [Candidatus Saccharibacteria bacterium]
MNVFLGIIVGLFVLTVLITAHEFGHFIAARRSGVRVKEFGIGFPPRAIAWVRSKPEKGKKKGKWTRIKKEDWTKEQNSLIFSLNWLPIGGFCAMDGESDDETRKGTFGSVSFWKKTKILFAGVTMNWLVAFIVLTVLCWTGLPEILTNQFSIKSDERITTNSYVTVGTVMEGSPAEAAGFMTDDRIVAINDQNIYTSSDVINFNNAHAGETVTYSILRAKPTTLEVTLNPADSEYLLGITMSAGSVTRHYTWSAPVVAAGLTVQLTGETFKGLGQLVVNLVTGAARQISSDVSVREEGKEQISEATEGVSGIVGIIGGYFPNLISAGPTFIFLFMAIISISLACMNVLPIPALDGGRWFMIFLCRLRHKKLSKEKEQSIVAKAFIFLLILMAIITVMDIIKLF